MPFFDLGVHACRQELVEVFLQLYVGATIAVYRRGYALACRTEFTAMYDILDMGLEIGFPWDDSGELSVLGTCKVEHILLAILECDLNDLMTVFRIVVVIRCCYTSVDEAATVILRRDQDIVYLLVESFTYMSDPGECDECYCDGLTGHSDPHGGILYLGLCILRSLRA